jgi:hypothetical protein
MGSTEKTDAGWIRARHGNPCPICGRNSWCQWKPSGLVHCMRITSQREAANGGWLHKAGETNGCRVELAAKVESKPDVDWTVLARQMYSEPGAAVSRIRLADQLGVKLSALERLKVGCGRDGRGDFASFPIRDEAGTVTGITRRYWTGEKKTMWGSKGGLFYATDWLGGVGPVLLPEGASDVAACLSMGLTAIGRFSCLGSVKQLVKILASVRRPIVVIGEHDDKPDRRGKVEQCPWNCAGCSWCWPGKHGANATAKQLAKQLKRRVTWAFAPDEAKDIREWLMKDGDQARFLKELCNLRQLPV